MSEKIDTFCSFNIFLQTFLKRSLTLTTYFELGKTKKCRCNQPSQFNSNRYNNKQKKNRWKYIQKIVICNLICHWSVKRRKFFWTDATNYEINLNKFVSFTVNEKTKTFGLCMKTCRLKFELIAVVVVVVDTIYLTKHFFTVYFRLIKKLCICTPTRSLAH